MSVALAFVVGCKFNPTSPSLPTTLTLSVHESGNAGDARITFVELVSDNRCPMNVMCIQAGDAVVSISVRVGAVRGDYELALNDPARRSITHRGYIVELQSVRPYPVAGQPTAERDIRATFEVRE